MGARQVEGNLSGRILWPTMLINVKEMNYFSFVINEERFNSKPKTDCQLTAEFARVIHDRKFRTTQTGTAYYYL